MAAARPFPGYRSQNRQKMNLRLSFSGTNHSRRQNTLIRLFFAAGLIGLTYSAKAQVVYYESFEHVVPGLNYTIPLGWVQEQIGTSIDVDNKFHCSNVATFPSITARTGADMLAFNARDVIAGERSALATKRLDMRGGMPGGGASFNFWFYRDNVGAPAATDRIQVYVNDSAEFSGGATGAVLLTEISTGATTIHRSCTQSPVPSVINGWNQCSYTIPNVSPFNGSSVYVIIVATSGAGYNMFIDDFTVNTYPLAQNYVANSAEVVSQAVNTTAAGKSGERIIGCRLTMDGAGVPRVLTNMEFNTNGSTNPTGDITNARLWFTGGTPAFDTSYAVLMGTYNNPWMTNYMFLTAPNANYTGMASFNGLEHGYNYFWITYNISPTAATSNYVDAEWINFAVNGMPITPFTMTLPGSRVIWANVTVPLYSSYCGGTNHNRTCWIDRVILQGNMAPGAGIDNSLNTINSGINAGPACPPPYPRTCPWQTHPSDYELFQPVAGKTTSVTADGTTVYTLSVRVGSLGSGNHVAAWIDFNGDFAFTANEKIGQSSSLPAYTTFNINFTVPDTAKPGMALLRVREAISASNMSPTGTHVYGETEDYIITIIPDCPGVPGWTTWLGITDNWADPVNWCPSVVPIAGNTDKNVRIPGGPTGTYTYHRPYIRDSIQARALKLRIEGADTIFVDATKGSTLTVLDSMKIVANTGAIIVNSGFADSAQVSNGLLPRPNDTPLSAVERTRSLVSITQAELLAEGMRAGDLITGIRIHMQRKSNGSPYKNFTIKYYYTTNAQSIFGVGAAANIPIPSGAPAAPVTVFSGDLDPSVFIPTLNDFGTVLVPLSTPIPWNGGANPMIIEMCYDNTGFPLTGTNDEVRFTQTTNLRRYLTIRNLSAYNKPGCSLSPKDTVISPSTGTAGTNTVTVAAVDAPDILPGQMTNLGLQVVSVAGNVVTLNANLPIPVNGNLIFYNTITTSINYRPNLTFEFSRPYNRFPISVAGHWENNGTFVPAVSIVTMNGAVANQKISGTSTTNFYDLKISNSNHVLLTSDVTVSDSLILTTGRLKLNNRKLSLTNPAIGALNRVNGYIQSETDVIASNLAPFGRFHWNMGSATGSRLIPFINMMGEYLPMNYNIDAGTHDVTFATYRTLQNNTNIPAPEVTNIAGFNNGTGGVYGSDGWAMVDRYYMISNAGSGAQADITMRYSVTEQAQGGNVNMRAQRWMNTPDLWEFPFLPGQVFTPGNPNIVMIPDFTGFSGNDWWAITGNISPLPVTLLDFSGEKKDKRVLLKWTTASEINSSHFDVERTVDNHSFMFIDRVPSQGSGNNIRHYEAWDNEPLEGIQYYYLIQYDIDNNSNTYGPVSVRFDSNIFDIVTMITKPGEQGLSVAFNYNSDEPLSCRIYDITGRLIFDEEKYEAVRGFNNIDIDVKMAKGVYQVVLQNSEKVITRKFLN
jgi:hypothetical protein